MYLWKDVRMREYQKEEEVQADILEKLPGLACLQARQKTLERASFYPLCSRSFTRQCVFMCLTMYIISHRDGAPHSTSSS